MNTAWYVVKVLPGKERSLTEQFNKDIGLGRINKIVRFVCPTEKEFVVVKNKKVIREKVLYSGYLYFESLKQLENDDLKIISLIPNKLLFTFFLISIPFANIILKQMNNQTLSVPII